MQVTIEVRNMFTYSTLPIILLLIFILSRIISYIKKRHNLKEITIIEPSIKDKSSIKKIYLSKIEELKIKVINNKISNRKAYQELSKIIRVFIFEMTNIKVQFSTLSDIKNINMPTLYELVSEYYDPEFAKVSKGNIINSIEKTRKVIEKWN